MGEDRPALHRMTTDSGRRVRWIIGVALSATLVWIAFSANGSVSDRLMEVGKAEQSERLPDPVVPAFAAADPAPLGVDRWDSVWALVDREVVVRARPTRSSQAVGRVVSVTPEGTDNIVQSLNRAIDRRGRMWVKIRFPSLPNGAVGWIPRSAIGGYGVVHTKLVIDLGSSRARLFRGGRLLFQAPIGMGRAGWPTPVGRFYIRNRLEGFGDPFYGPVAFGTSARSPVATDWPAGGFVGIHGTDSPELIPGAVSHGCIRMRNRDVTELSRLMPIGTPVRIRS
jgi:lipoprotein-anchoring transpeptidase ErfK/SrfK